MKSIRLFLLLLLAPSLAFAQGLVSDLNVQRTVRFGSNSTGTISPAQITSNQNNYAPTGYATAFRLRINSDAARTITGLAAGFAGEIKVLTNIGTTYTITLADSSGSSTAANQFALAGDFQLLPDSSIPLEYDGTSQRWRVWGPTAAMLSGSFQPIDPALTALAGGSDFVVFSGPASSNKTFTLPNASSKILTDNAAVTVAEGGTGRATGTTAYGLIAAGTTATGAQQTLAAGGTAQILVGGGSSALPVWTTATGTGAPVRATSPALITPDIGAASGSSLSITGLISSTVTSGNIFNSQSATTGANYFRLQNSGGVSYFGLEDSTGSQFGGSAYSFFIYAPSTVDTLIAGTKRTQVSSTGLSVTGTTTSSLGVVAGSGGQNVSTIAFGGGFAGAGGVGLDLTENDNASGGAFAQFRNSSAAIIGSITRVTTTNAVAYNTTSDGRLKENIRDFTGEESGPIIDGLRPRWFDWKASPLNETVQVEEVVDGKKTTKPVLRPVTDKARLAKHAEDNRSIIGFIAQEEAAVDPALIRAGAVTVGDNDPARITKQWQRSDAALVPILVAEVKALRARVAALEAKTK